MPIRTRLRVSLMATCAITLAASASDIPAPRILEPRQAASQQRTYSAPGIQAERIVIKFKEGTHVRLRSDHLIALSRERTSDELGRLDRAHLSKQQVDSDVASVNLVMTNRSPALGALKSLFREPEQTLRQRQILGETRSGRELADLSLYFEIPLLATIPADQIEHLLEAINQLSSIEIAYAEPPTTLASARVFERALGTTLINAPLMDVSPTTPSFDTQQGYLGSAPAGIDARYAWTYPGGSGSNVNIVDIEGAWRATHEDLPYLFYSHGGQLSDDWVHHGTAVLGQLVGGANLYGITGIAYGASAGQESIASQSTASAISYAAGASGPGGIILIELHRLGPTNSTPCTCNTSQCDYIPVEYWPADWDAVNNAVAIGVVVVEAAGNDSSNLDDPAYHHAFDRARDSGAILVAAGSSTTRAPMCFTNFGTRIDLYSWGEGVTTLGYGDLFNPGSQDQLYTAVFSGTSSASPMIAGAAAILQGVRRAAGLQLLDSREARWLLATNGTPQANDSRTIGYQPDLRRAVPAALAFSALVCPTVWEGDPVGSYYGIPYDNCNYLMSDGCETPLNSNSNCGACNRVCDPGQACQATGGTSIWTCNW